MINVRNLWLTNSDEEKYELTDQKDRQVFLANPSGLGLRINYSTTRIGDNEKITSKIYEILPVDGELLFYNNSLDVIYENYFTFLQFISKSPIYLHYKTPNSNESYRTLCEVESLGKTEVDKDGAMHCPITFKRLTHWYSDREIVYIATNDIESGGKEYPLIRPYSYGLLSPRNIPITNDSIMETPFKFEIDGEVTDLQYSVSQNGEVYGRGKLIGSYDYVMVNSDELEENIVLKIDDSIIPNAFNYQDLTVGSPNKIYVTFLHFKPGNSILNFSLGNDFNGKVKVSWRKKYLSV